MATFVLIPGMCHGAWCFDELSASLREVGHHVLALTLTGVAERGHLLPGGVNLDTHITDVLAAVDHDADAGDDLILVGHSYGGMVIAGVADRIPDRVDSLVFLDAVVPRDGEACWDIVNDEERQWYVNVDASGFRRPTAAVLRPARDRASAGVGAAAGAAARRPEPVPAPGVRLCARLAGRITVAAVIRPGPRRSGVVLP